MMSKEFMVIMMVIIIPMMVAVIVVWHVVVVYRLVVDHGVESVDKLFNWIFKFL